MVNGISRTGSLLFKYGKLKLEEFMLAWLRKRVRHEVTGKGFLWGNRDQLTSGGITNSAQLGRVNLLYWRVNYMYRF